MLQKNAKTKQNKKKKNKKKKKTTTKKKKHTKTLYHFLSKVGRKTLRNGLNFVSDLIQDISWEKGQHKKDAKKDITSDSQVNSYFPYRWSPASLTISIYFYLFLYLYITRITINNGTPHLKSLKSQNRRAALERPAIKLLGEGGGLQLVCGRPTLARSSALYI